MKFYSYISAAMLFAGVTLTACSESETVDNRVMDTSALKPASVLIDGMADSSTQRFNLTMVNPDNKEVSVVYGVDASLVDAYNAIFSDKAIMLPQDNYNLVEPVAVFAPGAVTSSDVVVDVTNLNTLDRNKVYVLPLNVKSSTVPVLDSQKTRYIVVRGAALINVVADMTDRAAFLNSASNASGLKNIEKLTVQMLVNVNEFGGSEAGIQTLLGVEGMFLLRLGDSEPIDQIQLATFAGNVSDPSWSFKAKEWTKLTFTFDSTTGDATMFINGARKATKVSAALFPVDWGVGSFAVGYSYSFNRYLKGCMSEVRVWNRILSDAEIANPDQAYIVSPDSEGLVAYWKFNEGAGTLIHDYANGYDLIMGEAPVWVPVSLPE